MEEIFYKIIYIFLNHKMNEDIILQDCADLFSNHYGIWKSGFKIKLNVEKLNSIYLFDDSCGYVYAKKGNIHIGQCFYCYYMAGIKSIVCITQLVVHKEYRHKGIATRLVTMALENPWNKAYIASSNPYAIRSLERATKSKCIPLYNDETLLKSCPVPYLKNKKTDITYEHSYVNTEFNICHLEINDILTQVEGNWVLGNKLPDGYEFLGIITKF
jgi:GNAT superfamily N-acetyltransferase